jgi:hypothetical protein
LNQKNDELAKLVFLFSRRVKLIHVNPSPPKRRWVGNQLTLQSSHLSIQGAPA